MPDFPFVPMHPAYLHRLTVLALREAARARSAGEDAIDDGLTLASLHTSVSCLLALGYDLDREHVAAAGLAAAMGARAV